jgi:hypothetical protein
MYSYVANNPLKFVDPSGMEFLCGPNDQDCNEGGDPCSSDDCGGPILPPITGFPGLPISGTPPVGNYPGQNQ